VVAIGIVVVAGIVVSVIGLLTSEAGNGLARGAYALGLIAGLVTLGAGAVGFVSDRRDREETLAPHLTAWANELQRVAELGDRLVFEGASPSQRVYYEALAEQTLNHPGRPVDFEILGTRRPDVWESLARIQAARESLRAEPEEYSAGSR
jgi:hypothetical protein